MTVRWGGVHGTVGLVSVLLSLTLLAKKGVLLLDDIVVHGAMHAALDILLYELPLSVFTLAGRAILAPVGADIEPATVGLVVAYPLLVVATAAAIEGPNPRPLAGYWVGATVITGVAVLASLGTMPDPGGLGSTLVEHLVGYTVAAAVADGLSALAAGLGWLIPGGQTGATVVVVAAAGVVFGIAWELGVGHREPARRFEW